MSQSPASQAQGPLDRSRYQRMRTSLLRRCWHRCDRFGHGISRCERFCRWCRGTGGVGSVSVTGDANVSSWADLRRERSAPSLLSRARASFVTGVSGTGSVGTVTVSAMRLPPLLVFLLPDLSERLQSQWTSSRLRVGSAAQAQWERLRRLVQRLPRQVGSKLRALQNRFSLGSCR